MKTFPICMLATCLSTAAFAAMNSDMMGNATEIAGIIGPATGEDGCGKDDLGNSDRTVDLFMRLAEKCGASSGQSQSLMRTLEEHHADASGDGCVGGVGGESFKFHMDVMNAVEYRLHVDAVSCEEAFDLNDFPSK